MNFKKSVLVLLGKYRDIDVVNGAGHDAEQLRSAMADCGLVQEKIYSLQGDTVVEVPKWHGVGLAGEQGTRARCVKLADEAARCAAGIVESQKATKAGARGREATARWRIASSVLYPLQYQVPHCTKALSAALRRIQVAMSKVSTGGY